MSREPITRRHFLQAAAAMSAGAVLADLPGFGDMAAHARPLGPTDGVLVVVDLSGGNDARNTLVPVGDPRYHELRGPLALSADRVLPLDGASGLHPSLRFLKRRWDAGQLAIVEGVGDPDPDLSHFVSMARWMSGSRTDATTGWLGRYLDALGGDAFDAVHIGTEIPLTVVGSRR